MPHYCTRPRTPVPVIISCKTLKNRSVENTVRTRETWLCSDTPRFSYGGPKTCVRARVRCLGWCVRGGWYRVGIQAGWVPGWVYQVGNTGVQHAKDEHLLSGGLTAERAPEGPAGPWSGWSVCSAPRTSGPHPSGPVGPPVDLPGTSSSSMPHKAV